MFHLILILLSFIIISIMPKFITGRCGRPNTSSYHRRREHGERSVHMVQYASADARQTRIPLAYVTSGEMCGRLYRPTDVNKC